ncbi:hypothetical protein EVAR_25987_1 [Eumeta japonica]|uniref:Uncharacterized protein n=1 Tax=Eumeta variegata TaxID=151549 RepID=A0A4C1V2R7_EUMVA|nr:hypothetical protein EVAR_25987_1 [Eumeta japonica]
MSKRGSNSTSVRGRNREVRHQDQERIYKVMCRGDGGSVGEYDYGGVRESAVCLSRRRTEWKAGIPELYYSMTVIAVRSNIEVGIKSGNEIRIDSNIDEIKR